MDITLKRALKLKKDIETFLTTQKPVLSKPVSTLVHDPIETAKDTHFDIAEALKNFISRHHTLSLFLIRLRVAIESSNTLGINHHMAEIAHMDRMIKLLTQVVAAPVHDDDVLFGEIKFVVAQRQTATGGYYGSQHIDVQAVHETSLEVLNDQLRVYKRSRQNLDEKRQEMNGYLRITISDDDTPLLAELGFI